MSALEALERVTRLDQHLASHDYAERVYGRVLDLLGSGSSSVELRQALLELHRRAYEHGQVVERDAYVEVLDALDAEHPPVPA
jgi:hypothetical protein